MSRQIAMVIDLNKCIGCQTCTVACKTLWTDGAGQETMLWNNVETVPGQGYPRNWQNMGGGWKEGELSFGELPAEEDYGKPVELNYREVYQTGKDYYLHAKEKMTWGPNWDEDVGAGVYPNNYHFYLPRLCNHCTHPACLEACPVRAIYKREEDGIVLIDEKKCQGFRECIRACPYKKIYFNLVKGVSQKCIFCFPRIEKGIAPACARQCPGRLRFVGFLDDPTGPIYLLVHKWQVALPLHEEYGTQPNVFYVPPLLPDAFDEEGRFSEKPRIPLEYLRFLFGPRVDSALATLKAEMAKRQRGEPSELMDLLIAKDWKSLFKIPKVIAVLLISLLTITTNLGATGFKANAPAGVLTTPTMGVLMGGKDQSAKTLKIARAAFEHFKHGLATGQWEPFLGMLTDDFTLYFPTGKYQGLNVGKARAAEFLRFVSETFKEGLLITEVISVTSSATTVGFECRVEGKLGEQPYKNRVAIFLDVCGDKICAFREYFGSDGKSN